MELLDIEEIRDAIEMLKKFEANLPSVKYIDYFMDGIDTLNDYLADHPETPHKNFINNQKVAYTRRVLQFLKSIDSSDFSSWINVFFALFKSNDEIEKLSESNPDLKKDYDDFIEEWKETPELSGFASKLSKVK